MANENKVINKTNGVTEVEINGKKYKVCIDMNCMAWIEDNYDIPFQNLVESFSKGNVKVSDIRKIIGGSLQYDAIEKGKDEYTKAEINKILAGADINELMTGMEKAMGKLTTP
jgi:hypothetical protein